LELGHAEVAEFGGESVDGSECSSSGGRKDKSMRPDDEYAFISFGIRNRELVFYVTECAHCGLPLTTRSRHPFSKTNQLVREVDDLRSW